jgi:hypothetical protein
MNRRLELLQTALRQQSGIDRYIRWRRSASGCTSAGEWQVTAVIEGETWTALTARRLIDSNQDALPRVRRCGALPLTSATTVTLWLNLGQVRARSPNTMDRSREARM